MYSQQLLCRKLVAPLRTYKICYNKWLIVSISSVIIVSILIGKIKKISWIEDFTTNLVIQTTANYKWYNTQNLKLLLYPAKRRPFIFIFEGLMAFPFSHCAYLASKHGVVGFTRAYAKVGACHNGGGHFAIIVFRINGLETQLKFCYLCSSNICKGFTYPSE